MPIKTEGCMCMRVCDKIICALVFVVGILWFVAAEVVYDGSLMENPFWRSGMLALWYVPLATMYWVKSAWGESRKVDTLAWLASFLVLSAMMSADVLVTHYKPNSDHRCIPVGTDFASSLLGSFVFSIIVTVSDLLVLCWLRKHRHPVLMQWFIRRTIRLGGTMLFVVLLVLLVNGVFFVIGQVLRGNL